MGCVESSSVEQSRDSSDKQRREMILGLEVKEVRNLAFEFPSGGGSLWRNCINKHMLRYIRTTSSTCWNYDIVHFKFKRKIPHRFTFCFLFRKLYPN